MADHKAISAGPVESRTSRSSIDAHDDIQVAVSIHVSSRRAIDVSIVSHTADAADSALSVTVKKEQILRPLANHKVTLIGLTDMTERARYEEVDVAVLVEVAGSNPCDVRGPSML